ncbi:glucans biosynthesis protein [Roseiarcus fermentans]|uniref:Glucans biosynthesis protein n=1 Tax=Roseiarcus fermentans TaxID=1473586 RepID=A0A366ERY3_9HYPH|nr:glucan biosynthesis protein G [Roseiarcus fermentans]RBP05167.1 glucans biosynthesis protein [Roseiarcus fermentans]
MPDLSRRALVLGAAVLACAPVTPAGAQGVAAPQGAATPFGFQDVVKRARDLAAAPYDATIPPLPDGLANLDYDAWRDIRFKSDKPLLGQQLNATFRLELFHLGHLYKRPVIINVLRDGIPAPIPYATNLFDYGRNKVSANLPINLGFAGFRLKFPINAPHVWDEVVAFLGASYFRFLGRGQRYGLSARGLAIGGGRRLNEEFPYFREFWIETPGPNAETISINALLDGESATGAFRFELTPGQDTYLETGVTLFARKTIPTLGLAPLSSMFFVGKNDRRFTDDFRSELHDSDGLLMHTGAGEWIWRPLSNPLAPSVSAFLDRDPRGFGLLQRDRNFSDYQDLDLAYELRPSYWIEPRDNWGEGKVELLELPTNDETNDNVVAAWAPNDPLEAGKSLTYGYRITALTMDQALSPGGRTVATFRVSPRALGSPESPPPGATRFLIDFAGGDLPFYMSDPSQVEAIATASNGRILRTFLTPNAHTRGFRAGVDVAVDSGQSTDLRVFLRSGPKALTETWTFPWRG